MDVLKQIGRAVSAAISFCQMVFFVVFLPWRTSYEPVHALLNCAEDQRDELTLTWRTQKLNELSSVGITVGNLCPRSF
jgi:hypothetical protein